ncbi:hypothetical protein B0T19DRAFT_424954 [Cercophora scortea]|uniref:Uncharacterized protein n=1 Tax=Cercophora scortea TaxID=314031 RepID=A0AAE0IQB3_9PEZI|nr:hypothetical protein B0T19DRAFT_424954 [Cercophora scortea]
MIRVCGRRRTRLRLHRNGLLVVACQARFVFMPFHVQSMASGSAGSECQLAFAVSAGGYHVAFALVSFLMCVLTF